MISCMLSPLAQNLNQIGKENDLASRICYQELKNSKIVTTAIRWENKHLFEATLIIFLSTNKLN